MDHDETLACLVEVGIEVDGEFSLDVLKGALRNRYGARERSVREVFDMLDEDDSGALDVAEGGPRAAAGPKEPHHLRVDNIKRLHAVEAVQSINNVDTGVI